MKSSSPVRAFGVALAVPQTVVGIWATLSPRGWFDSFPGIGPALAAAEPPFNPHLVTDAAAGFLATGGLLLLASLHGGQVEIRAGAVAYLLFCVPHLIYHAAHPSQLLPAFNDALNLVLIGTQVLGAVGLVLLTTHRKAIAWAS